jgi:hypothetical protein
MLWNDLQRNESGSGILLLRNITLQGGKGFFCLICMAIGEVEDGSYLTGIKVSDC